MDAFANIPKRPPPNLPGMPGYSEEPPQPPPAEKPRRENAQKQEAKGEQPQRKSAGREKNVVPAKKRRRHRRRAAVLFLTAVMLCIAFLFVSMLKIQNFELSGECPYTVEDIAEVFGAAQGDNLFFSFDAGDEQERIQQLLPYIEHVNVRRRPLNTVVFQVTPAVETYAVRTGDEYAVLSQSRKVLCMVDTAPDGVVLLEGIEEAQTRVGFPFSAGDEEVQTALDDLLQALAQHEFAGVVQVDVSDPMRMSFNWQNRFTIIVGGRSNLDAKLTFVHVLLTDTGQTRFTDADKGTIDVSGYPATPNAIYSPE